MNSSIAAVTLMMGVGSGLSSVMKLACHGSGLTVVPDIVRPRTFRSVARSEPSSGVHGRRISLLRLPLDGELLRSRPRSPRSVVSIRVSKIASSPGPVIA